MMEKSTAFGCGLSFFWRWERRERDWWLGIGDRGLGVGGWGTGFGTGIGNKKIKGVIA
jgi:hypothetical protein